MKMQEKHSVYNALMQRRQIEQIHIFHWHTADRKKEL